MPGRVVLRLLLAGLFVSAAVVPVSGAGAQGAGALEWQADTTFTARPDDGRVDVVFEYTFRNVGTGIGFPGFFESLPSAAIEVEARSGSRELEVSRLIEDTVTTIWSVTFADTLDPGDEVAVELRWAIPHGATAATVVAPGAVAFDAFRPGADLEAAGPGSGVVRVVVPGGYRSVDGYFAVTGPEPGSSTIEAYPVAYELVHFRFIDQERFDGDLLELPPLAAITSWVGDDRWVDAVADRAADVTPELDTWFGHRDEPFRVRRTFATDEHPAVAVDAVDLVDDDAVSVDHQLAHVWLADVVVDEPWFIEGLALGFAGESGIRGAPDATMADLVDELGAAGVRAVVDALRAESTPYPGPIPEPRVLPPDWRTLLDLIERVGGVGDAATAFRGSITDDAGDALIDRRAAAVVDYAALEERAGSWALPPFLRTAMATWDFDTFFARQAEVSDVIATRDSLAGWAESLELEHRIDAEAVFEAAAEDLTEVVALLDLQAEALEAFDEAEAAVNGDRGLLATIGLFGSDPDGDLVDLRERWAAGDDAGVVHHGHELTESIEGAVGRGTIRLLIPALSVIAVWQGVRWLRRRAGEATAGAQANTSA